MSQHQSSLALRSAGLASAAFIPTPLARLFSASILLAVLLSGALAQAAPPAAAEPAAADKLPPYETLDANKDGIVTLPEITVFSPPLAKRIQHCDSNGNKTLSRAEYAACQPKPAAKPAPAANESH